MPKCPLFPKIRYFRIPLYTAHLVNGVDPLAHLHFLLHRLDDLIQRLLDDGPDPEDDVGGHQVHGAEPVDHAEDAQVEAGVDEHHGGLHHHENDPHDAGAGLDRVVTRPLFVQGGDGLEEEVDDAAQSEDEGSVANCQTAVALG